MQTNGPADTPHGTFAFGPFRLVPAQKLLLDGDRPVAVGARAFDLLVALVRHAGEVVGKAELLAQAWPGITVEEGNLRVHITALRKALGDGHDGRRFIVNSPGRGYSFVAIVSHPEGGATADRGGTAILSAGNLPRPAQRLLGRDRLIALMVVQLPQRRLVTVTGSGGIGKTTFALAVADALRSAYKNSVYLVDLAPITEAALVPSVLASALGLPVSSGAPIPGLLNVLRDKDLLLVLDNCEHVVDVAAMLAHEIVHNAPGVHILATSHQPLRVAGEHVQRLSPLDVPPAVPRITAAQALTYASVRLFAERAAALLDTFELTDANAPVVATICRRLDGIALAIEFAAARIDTLGVRGVADRLDDRFRLLKRGARTAHSRHQTLHATFEWSYDLLPMTARTVLRRLAVFAGPFTFASAAAVVAGDEIDEATVADELSALVTASLVAADPAAEPVTYRLLESTRAYALEQLTQTGERARVSGRHAAYLLRLLRDAAALSSTSSNGGWAKALGQQLDNLRAALDWAFCPDGNVPLGIELTIVTVPLWQGLSLTEECRSRAAMALAELSGESEARRHQEMQLHAALGGALALRSDVASTAAWTSTLSIAESIGDRDYQLRALRGLWRNTYTAGDSATARMFADRFAHVATASGAASMQRVSEYMAGMNSLYAGELKAARLNIGRAMRANDDAHETTDVQRFSIEQTVVSSANLATILWLQGCPDEATRMAERSVTFASSGGHGLSLAYALAWSSCRIAIQTGDLPGAERHLRRLADQVSWNSLGQWDLICRCWTGVLRARRGDPQGAADLLAAALLEIPEGNFRLHHTSFLGERAHALGRIGRPLQALDAIEKSIAICDRLDERWFYPELLRFKGEIVLAAAGVGAATAAEEQLRLSLDWAGRQGALSWELRAATSLARLQHAQGRTSEACNLLAAVHGRFAEGFTTGDLRAAKALLDELAPETDGGRTGSSGHAPAVTGAGGVPSRTRPSGGTRRRATSRP